MSQADIRKTKDSGDKYIEPADDVQNLLSQIIEFENELKKQEIEAGASRSHMPEYNDHDLLRAELVAEFVKLCACNTEDSAAAFTTGLDSFCSRICDMKLASVEIIGTYLAAREIADRNKLDEKIVGFNELLRRTMLDILHKCISILASRAKTSILVPKKSRKKTAPTI